MGGNVAGPPNKAWMSVIAPSVMTPRDPLGRAVLRSVLIVVSVAIVLYLIVLLQRPLTWLVIAAFIAIAMSGPVNLLERHMKRGLAVALAYAALVMIPIGARSAADPLAGRPDREPRRERARSTRRTSPTSSTTTTPSTTSTTSSTSPARSRTPPTTCRARSATRPGCFRTSASASSTRSLPRSRS